MAPLTRDELISRIESARTRGQQKELGRWLDQQDDITRRLVIDIARERGEELPNTAMAWPSKKLIRRARAKQEESRRRTNPIRIDDPFFCVVCGSDVKIGGAKVRDHCPFCLHSRHVDRIPGDRSAGCGGTLVPVSLDKSGDSEVINYECDRCEETSRCSAHPDDDRELLVALSARGRLDTSERLRVIGLPNRILDTCKSHSLIHGKVAVAVSGGVDSIVLMHIMHRLGFSPTVISLDHGLRAEAASEVEHVRRVAKSLGLDFCYEELHLMPGPDVAARARHARFECFEKMPFDTIALGHHRDDQVETVIDRLIRGSGSGGLGGMRYRRDRYIRPMLSEPRSVIEAWALLHGIKWCEDPSNKKGTRGRIRHEVVPLLESIREGANTSIARSAVHLAGDHRYLSREADKLMGVDGVRLSAWDKAPSPLKYRAILKLIKRSRGGVVDVAKAQVDGFKKFDKPGSWLPLPGGWRLLRDNSRIRCLPNPPEPRMIKSGHWGHWSIDASSEVMVRGAYDGERAGDTSMRERLRVAGISVGLRDYHPVVEVNGRRWLPGVWVEPSKSTVESGGMVRVLATRLGSPSLPSGGPWGTEI
jgi:tRNA(Ile)-lysidine synthetase-like protein